MVTILGENTYGRDAHPTRTETQQKRELFSRNCAVVFLVFPERGEGFGLGLLDGTKVVEIAGNAV